MFGHWMSLVLIGALICGKVREGKEWFHEVTTLLKSLDIKDNSNDICGAPV